MAKVKKREKWSHLTDNQLLGIRICDLDLSIGSSPINRQILKLRKELVSRGIKFKPHFWISTEWFCPDGVPGVAIPFTLLHPRLKKLEKKFLYRVEGNETQEFLKILRHEVGHAIDNAYRLRKKPNRTKIFGNSRKSYPSSYEPQLYSRHFVKNIGGGYAQSHPDEDFAESFAVWLTSKTQWRKKYRTWPALEKLKYMDLIMQEIATKKPILSNKRRVDDVSKSKMTLKKYFQKKRQELRLFRLKSLDSELRSITTKNGKTRLSVEINRRKNKIKKNVAKKTGEPQYVIERIITDSILRARVMGYKVSIKPNFENQLNRYFLKISRTYLRRGHHRIVM